MTYYLFNGNNNSPGVSCLILNTNGTRMAIIVIVSQLHRNLSYTRDFLYQLLMPEFLEVDLQILLLQFSVK